MTTDLLLNDAQREMLPKMLRAANGQRASYEFLWRMCGYAADEIERLRAALDSIIRYEESDNDGNRVPETGASFIAREALARERAT